MESSESLMRTTPGQHGGKGGFSQSLDVRPDLSQRFEITSDELACRVWFVSRRVPGDWTLARTSQVSAEMS